MKEGQDEKWPSDDEAQPPWSPWMMDGWMDGAIQQAALPFSSPALLCFALLCPLNPNHPTHHHPSLPTEKTQKTKSN